MQQATGTLFLILAIAFTAPLLSSFSRKIRLPTLVFEILLGILVGPDCLNLVRISDPITLLAELGLATLIFLAGFELDTHRVRGAPIRLALGGWGLSIVLGLAVAGLLQVTGVVRSELYTGLALTTTALGTLIPVLRDSGLLPTRFGSHVLAIGSVGEFGPIIAVALVLSGTNPGQSTVALVCFVVAAVGLMAYATRAHPARLRRVLGATLRSSGQLYIRLAAVLIALMAFVAAKLGLDVLLGAFTAGVVFRLFLKASAEDDEVEVIESKLEALSFGYLVPIFFVVTGVNFDLHALTSSPSAMLKVPLFALLFLVVRGLPVASTAARCPSCATARRSPSSAPRRCRWSW